MQQIVILSGSYTIEAAVIIPLFLLVMAIGIRSSICLYQESSKMELYDQKMWGVEEFYRSQSLEKLLEEKK